MPRRATCDRVPFASQSTSALQCELSYLNAVHTTHCPCHTPATNDGRDLVRVAGAWHTRDRVHSLQLTFSDRRRRTAPATPLVRPLTCPPHCIPMPPELIPASMRLQVRSAGPRRTLWPGGRPQSQLSGLPKGTPSRASTGLPLNSVTQGFLLAPAC